VSALIPLPGSLGGGTGGGGSTGGQKPYYIDSDTGRTVREANNKLQRRMTRYIFYAHRRVMLMSDTAAAQGLNLLFDSISRIPENRMSSYLLVSEGKAADVLGVQPKMERFSAEFMRELA